MWEKNIFFGTDTFECCFRYAIIDVQAIKDGLEFNETHHILISIDDNNFFVENINTTTESLILQFAMHVCKYIENCYLACCFLWWWGLVSRRKGRTNKEGVWE
jgi:hypothetical protein